jgi:hypothetical protein
MTTAGNYRIMIYGPKEDSTYVVEFRTAEGESLAISIPSTETAVIRRFQERMPYGLVVSPPRRKPTPPLASASLTTVRRSSFQALATRWQCHTGKPMRNASVLSRSRALIRPR